MKSYCLATLLISLLTATQVYGQTDTLNVTFELKNDLKEHIRLFESDDILELTLRFDITTFKRKRSAEEELDALLTIHLNDTTSINKEIKLRARGIMRKSYCDIPPIRLNLKKASDPADEFSNIDKIKVVTHCKVGSSETLLKEFLVYKLFNVLTEKSLRVRLARITYINTTKKSKPIQDFAILIEPDEVLLRRLNRIEIKPPKMSQKLIEPEVMDRMAIFNYMVGNTDWSVPIYHNVVVLSQTVYKQNSLFQIIPYDFDQSGIVNAVYAAPFEGLGIKSVKERRYLGVCRSEGEFAKALEEFSEKKDEFRKVILGFPHLKEKTKKEMILYLDSFLNGLDKRNTNVYILRRECIDF